MATNHTTNYNLNLWEPSDKFVREEFNENTTKLDAALATKATTAALTAETNARTSADSALAARVTALENKSRYTKLKEFVSTEASSFLEIYLNDINWAQWDRVHVEIQSRHSGTYYFYKTDSTAYEDHVGTIGHSYHGQTWELPMTFYPGFQADRTLSVFNGEQYKAFNMSYAQVVKMVFSGSIMPAGAKFVFWGEK